MAGAGVELEQVLGLLGAQPVTHTIEAGEIGGGLGGREHVVGGEPVWSVRQANVVELRAELPRARKGTAKGVEHTRIDPLAGELLGDAQAHAGKRLGGGQRDLLGVSQGGGVALVAADHVAQQQRRIGDIAGQRPGLIERGGEGDHPVARDGAVGRFQPDDPAQRGRLADRSACVGAERPGSQAGGDSGGAAPRGPPGHAGAIPRVEHRAEGGVLVGGAHRELVLVGLGKQRCAGRGEPRNGGGGVGRAVALEDARARLRRHTSGAEQVLDGERHAA